MSRLITLNAMKASEEITEEQSRQVSHPSRSIPLAGILRNFAAALRCRSCIRRVLPLPKRRKGRPFLICWIGVWEPQCNIRVLCYLNPFHVLSCIKGACIPSPAPLPLSRRAPLRRALVAFDRRPRPEMGTHTSRREPRAGSLWPTTPPPALLPKNRGEEVDFLISQVEDTV